MKLTKLTKVANMLTLGLALATTLPAHAKILCYEEAPKNSAALEVDTNPDQSAAAILELDGVFTKYSGTYMVTTEATEQFGKPFKTLNVSLVDEVGQKAKFTATYQKIWSYSGFCGRAGCEQKVVTEILGHLASANVERSFLCYEAKAD